MSNDKLIEELADLNQKKIPPFDKLLNYKCCAQELGGKDKNCETENGNFKSFRSYNKFYLHMTSVHEIDPYIRCAEVRAKRQREHEVETHAPKTKKKINAYAPTPKKLSGGPGLDYWTTDANGDWIQCTYDEYMGIDNNLDYWLGDGKGGWLKCTKREYEAGMLDASIMDSDEEEVVVIPLGRKLLSKKVEELKIDDHTFVDEQDASASAPATA